MVDWRAWTSPAVGAAALGLVGCDGHVSPRVGSRGRRQAPCGAGGIPCGPSPEPHAIWAALADAAAVVLLLDAALGLLRPGHGSIAFVFFHLPRWLPLREAVPAVFALGLLLRVRPVIGAAIAVAGWNAVTYLALRAGGVVVGWAVPFSYLLAMALVPALFVRRRAPAWAVVPAMGALVLGHVLTFGHTNYRRPADAIVVFGARAYADGTPSQALRDRMATGVRLYRQGYADTLILSGGLSEPDVMRRLALDRGVPDSAIVLDCGGVNTAATLDFLRRRGGRYLAVSHSFHSARIKMRAERLGVELVTVPAHEPVPLTGEPYYVARECAAIAAYYLGEP